MSVEVSLPVTPSDATLGHVRAILLRGVQDFF
jgi:hypothetical protein